MSGESRERAGEVAGSRGCLDEVTGGRLRPKTGATHATPWGIPGPEVARPGRHVGLGGSSGATVEGPCRGRRVGERARSPGLEGVTAGRLKHDRPGQGESEGITSTEGRGGRAPIRLASEDPKYTCAKGVVASFSREFRAPWVLCEKSVCGGKRVQHQDFPGGHPSQYCSGPSALNCGVLMGSGVLALV